MNKEELSIKEIGNSSLLMKFKQLCYIRGGDQRVMANTPKGLDTDIAIAEEEIMRRLDGYIIN